MRRRLSSTLQIGVGALAVGLVSWLGASLGDDPVPQPAAGALQLDPALPPVVAWDGTGNAPPVTVMVTGVPTPSTAWGSCYTRPSGAAACADGAPGLDGRALPDVGAVAAVAFSFPDPGWSFEATFQDPGPGAEALARPSSPGTVTATGPHTFRVTPPDLPAPPARYRVDLSGRGPEGGDLVASILWTTPVGPIG